MSQQAKLERLVRRAATDERVLAVVLFGSAARGEATAGSDVDVCLVATGGDSRRELEELRIEYLGRFDLDVQVFQRLPLYVRTRVLKDGQVLFCRDEDALYAVAFSTVRRFERFKRTYRAYLEEVARG